MKLKQFETILIDAAINAKFCVSWSDDHKISLLAEDGVHVYELDPLSSEAFLNAIGYYWIPNKPTLQFFDSIANNRLNNLLWKLNRRQLCEIVVGSSMPGSFKSQTIQSLFSPLIRGESHISCLSESGCLEIYKMNLNKWMPILNVTEEWMNYCMFQAESELDFESLNLRISTLKIVTHTWFKDLSGTNVYLVTGHEDGGIVIWDVSVDKGVNVKTQFQAFETPSALAVEFLPDSLTFAVFVGVLNGRVLTFSFKEIVSAEPDLWKERDLIAASLIKPCHVKTNLYIFTVKHYVILLHILKALPKNLFYVFNTKWFEFPAPVVGFQKLNELVVVALQNQDFQTLKLSDDGKDAFMSTNSLRSFLKPEKDESDVLCYGLAISKNSALWVTVLTRVSCTDKPSRGVTRLQIYATNPVSYKCFSDPSGSGLLAKLSSTDQDIKLTEILDLLEIKKSEFSVEQTLSYLEDGDLTLLQLKLLLWEVKLKMYSSSSFPHFADFEAVEDRLKHRIVTKYAREQISGLGRTTSKTINPSILLAFLEEKNSNKRDINFFECSICKESLRPENFKTCSCANLHKFPRCNISFLPCTATPYAFCRRCTSVALYEQVSDETNCCLYCDGSLIADNRLRPKFTQNKNSNM